MATRKARVGRHTPMIAWATIIIIGPAVLYVLHVTGQYSRRVEHRLHSLSIAATKIDAILGNAGTSYLNLTNDPAYADEFFDRQPYVRRMDGAPPLCPERINEIHASIPRQMPILTVVGGRLQMAFPPDPKAGIRKAATPGQEPAPAQQADGCLADEGALAGGSIPSKVEVHLGSILDELALEEGLDLVGLADEHGRVVAQRSGHGRRLLSLAGLMQTTGGQLQPVELDSLRSSSTSQDVEVFGADYLLLAHPLQMPDIYMPQGSSAGGSGEPVWTLCALVRSRDAFRESLAVSPTLLVVLALLLVIGLLALPFIKLLLLQRRERLRFVDCYFLLLSTMLGLMLFTVLLADCDAFGAFRSSMEHDLEQLTTEVSTRLSDELTQLWTTLVDYDTRLSRSQDQLLSILDPSANGQNAPAGCFVTGLLSPDHLAVTCKEATLPEDMAADLPEDMAADLPEDLPGTIAAAFGPLQKETPIVSSMFWIAPETGWQVIKATTGERNTPQVRLTGREYYQAVEKNRLWPVDLQARPQVEYFVQSILSITTGERSAVLSIRSGIDPAPKTGTDQEPVHAADAGKPWAAAISTSLATVTNPVLPPGLGFAVVDQDGTVIFHSEAGRTVEENLFDQIDSPLRLRTAVQARVQQHLRASYMGRRQMLHVSPVQGIPWSVVAFADTTVLQTTNLEMLAEAVIMVLAYFFLVFVVPTLIYVLLIGKSAGWLWPDPREKRLYQSLSWLFACLITLSGVAILALPTLPLLVVSLTLPILATAAGARHFLSSHEARDRWLDAMAGWRDLRIESLLPMAAAIGLVAGGAALRPEPAQEPWLAFCLIMLVALTLLALVRGSGVLHGVLARLGVRSHTQHRRRLLGLEPYLLWHCLAAVLAWALIAVLPAAVFFRVAHRTYQVALARARTIQVEHALEERSRQIREWHRQRRIPDASTDGSLIERRLADPGDIYIPTTLKQGAVPAATRSAGSRSYILASIEADLAPGAWLAASKPIYDEVSAMLRSVLLTSDETAGLSWADPARTRLHVEPRAGVAGPVDSFAFELPVPVPVAPLGWWSWLGGLVLLAALVYWVRFSALNLFFARVQFDSSSADDVLQLVLSNHVVARTSSWQRRRELLERINGLEPRPLGDGLVEVRLRATGRAAGETTVVVHPDATAALACPEQRAALLGRLEQLLEPVGTPQVPDGQDTPGQPRPHLLLLVEDDPYDALAAQPLSTSSSDRDGGAADASGTVTATDAMRLSSALSRCVNVQVGVPCTAGGAWPGSSASIEAPSASTLAEPQVKAGPLTNRGTMSSESSASIPPVDLTGDEPDQDPDQEADERTTEELLGRYWYTWHRCTVDEQLVLIHLATESFVNPKQARVVRQLLARRVLVRDPVVRFRSPRLRTFVRSIAEQADLRAIERPGSGLGWPELRWILICLLIIIAAFLYTTQQTMFQTTIGLVSAVAVALPALLKAVKLAYDLKGGQGDV